MKRLSKILIVLLLFGAINNSFSQSWDRLITDGGSSGNEIVNDMVVDAQGNIYIIGTFSGAVSFGSTTLNSNGSTDFYITKYDSSGNVIYAVNYGGSSSDEGNAIAIDNSGNAYVTGSFSQFFNFGAIALLCQGPTDIFTAKLDTVGSVLWAKRAGGLFSVYGSAFEDRGLDIAVDNAGGVYVSGTFSGQSMTFGAFIHSATGGLDFVGKLNANTGTEQWIINAQASSPTSNSAIAYTMDWNPLTNSIIVSGENKIGITIGPGGQFRLSDLYIRQIFPNGTLGWYREISGGGEEIPEEIYVDNNGSIYLAGNFNGTLNFPAGNAIEVSLNNAQDITDAFLIKFNSDASAITFSKSIIGNLNVEGKAVAVDQSGNIYLAGLINGAPTLDNVPFPSFGSSDAYLVRLNSSGNIDWIETAGGTDEDLATNLFVRPDDKVILSGGFNGTAKFGNSIVSSLGFSDIFIAQIDCKPNIPPEFSGESDVCVGDTVIYSVPVKFGTNYNWNLSSGGVLDTTGGQVKVIWTTEGNHILSATPSNVCGFGETRNLTVEVKNAPSAPQILGDSAVCVGLGTYSISNPAFSSYQWSLSAGGNLVPLNTQSLVTWTAPGNYILSAAGINECGLGVQKDLNISVVSFPSTPPIIFGNTSSCLGVDTFSIIPQAETSYNWDLNGGGSLQQFDSFAVVNWTQSGTFILRVTPSNVCGTGSPSSQIVTVNQSPQNATVQGDSVACLGSSSFSLPSIPGSIYLWSLSGGGNLINLGNTSIVNWTNPGNYFVTASVQNSCGQSDIDTFNVEVRSSAVQPGPVSGSNSVCIGSQSYSVSQQLNQTYEWSLSSGGSLNFVNNQASVNWTQTGFHTLTVTALNDCGQGLSRNLVVEVKTVPSQPGVIFGDDEVCLGLENYNVFAESGITYNWSISGGGQIFPSNNSVSINWTLDGIYDLIVTPSNQCGNGTLRILPIEVKDLPEDIAGIEGIDTVCLGNQIYSVSNAQTGNDITFNWSLSGGGIIAPNGNSATISWNTPGNYTLTVRAQNQCGFGQAFSKIINVKNVNDQVLSIDGDDLVCLDTSLYNVPSITGFSYNWNLSGGGSLNANSNLAEVIWQNTGNYTLSVTSSDGCTKTLPIEVKDIPTQPSSINGDTVVCLGTKSYAINPQSGQTFNWSLSGGGNISGFGNAALANWTSIGAYNVEVSATNLCGTGPIRTQEVNVLTIPLEPVFISGDTLLCRSQTEAYVLNSKAFESYSWALDRAGLISPSDTFATVQWLDTGIANISVNATNLCGTGPSGNLNIEVDDVPGIPQISGPSQVCLDTILFTTIFDNNVNYNWSIGGSAILSDSLNTASIAFSDTGNYNLSLNLTNSCGTGITAQKNIEVFQVPAKPELIQGDTIVCLGFSSYQVAQKQNQSFIWSLSGGGILNALDNSATINWTNTGSYQIFIQASNLCGNGPIDTIDVEVRTTPSQPSSITGDVNVCLDSRTYSVNPLNNTDYAWSISANGNLISGDTAIANVNWTNTGLAIISVTASNLCGTSPAQSKSISIADIPGLPQFVSGDTLTCIGNEIYSIQPSAGLSYNWSLPGGGTIVANANQSTLTWNQTGNWDLIANLSNYCGTGPSDTLKVRVKTLPDTLSFINPDTLVCLGNVAYAVILEPEVSYSWSLNGGGSFSTVNNQAFVTWNTPGVYSLQVNPVNICGSGPSESVQVDVNSIPSTPQFLNLDTLSCIGTETYTASPQTNVNFLWNLSGGGGSSSNGNQFTVNWTNTGVFDISLSAFNFCGSSPTNVESISVNDIPSQPILISGNVEPCLENETYLINSTNASNYVWSISGGGILNAISDSAIVNWISPGSQNINARGENYCGLSPVLNISIDISDVPERPSSLAGSTSVCLGDTQAYSIQEEPGLTYQWRIENVDTINSDSSVVLINWVTGGEQLVLVKARNNCGASPETDLEVNVRTVPIFQGNIIGSDKICIGSNETYTVSFTPGFSYSWNLNEGGDLSAQENNALINWKNAGEFQLRLSADNSCGTSEPIFKQIIVDSFPSEPQILVQGDSLISNSERDNVWYLNGERIINGGLPFVIPTETGQYTLQVINSCGESEVSDFISFYGGDNLEDEIYVFPNPANNFIRIKIPLNLKLDYLRVINSEGRRIAGIDLDGNSIQDLDIDYLRPGIYFLELNIEGQGSYFKKLAVN